MGYQSQIDMDLVKLAAEQDKFNHLLNPHRYETYGENGVKQWRSTTVSIARALYKGLQY